MRVLVTGAGGYIGTVLSEMLVERGFEVFALDTYYFGEGRLPPTIEQDHIIKADIRSVGRSVFSKVEAVIDLAALSNDPAGELDPLATDSTNHLGRFRVASLAKSAGVARYVFPSSCSIYGFNETWVDETHPPNPLTTYARANLNAEQDILALADSKFAVTILRQATVYGVSRRMRFDLAVNDIVAQFYTTRKVKLTTGGQQWRPFVHVRDTSKAMIQCLSTDASVLNRQVFNVGSDDQNYQVFDMAQRIARALKLDFVYEWKGSPDARSYRVRFGKIRSALGFQPDMSVEDGAKEVWESLSRGHIIYGDPKTLTVEWYKRLVADGTRL
jgi:nucleoside-diphosphate-sugar epimerase